MFGLSLDTAAVIQCMESLDVAERLAADFFFGMLGLCTLKVVWSCVSWLSYFFQPPPPLREFRHDTGENVVAEIIPKQTARARSASPARRKPRKPYTKRNKKAPMNVVPEPQQIITSDNNGIVLPTHQSPSPESTPTPEIDPPE